VGRGTYISEERLLVRYLLTLSALAGLCLSGCGPRVAGGVAIDKVFLPFIPADTKVLAGIQLDKLKATPLYQRHRKDLEIPVIEGSSERFGIDPRRDISDLLIAWNGKRPLFFVRGIFKPAEIEQKLTSLRAPKTTYKSHQVFGDSKNSLAFLHKGFAVEGSVGDVQRTIDLEGSTTRTVPDELLQRLRQIPNADQVWMVSRGGLPFADLPMRSDVESALSNIVNFVSGVTLGVKADSGTHFQIDITCISDQGAQRVHDALRGGIGLARLSTKDNQRELMQVYDAVNVDQDKSLVHVRADYSGELTDKLFQELGQVRQSIAR